MRDEASATARFVAEHIVLLGPRIHAVLEVPQQQIEWTVRVLEAGGWKRGLLSPFRSSLVERFSIPGIRTHYVLRKKIIEREVRQAIGDGCRQVVVIGAGFDVLLFRLAEEFPSVRCIELDHPATQRPKRIVAERYRSNIDFVSGDLRDGQIRVPIEPEKDTVFVVEGVLMYFTEAEVAGILESIRRASRAGRLIMTAMRGDRFAGSNWMAHWWLKWRGEPFRWAIAPEATASFLARIGLRVLRVYDSEAIRAELPARAAGRRVAIGEFVVVAEW